VRATGVDAFGLFAPLLEDLTVKLTGVMPTGVDPFGVVVPAVLGRSTAGPALPIGVEPFAEFAPVDRVGVDAGVTFVS